MGINDKIGLGTVQFGLKYGINNTSGQVSPDAAREIVRFYCSAVNVPVLDTASVYGTSESVLGKIFQELGASGTCHIISKFPASITGAAALRESFLSTLEQLQAAHLYGFLAHDANAVINNREVYDEMIRLKAEGLVEKIGVSVYFPSQLQWFMDHKIPVDLVQLPYNIFDRRFEPLFDECKKAGMEIHTRSAFLQGLFFRRPADLPAHFDTARESIAYIQQLAHDHELALNKLLLLFCLTRHAIDRVIIGVDSEENIRNNMITDEDLLKYEKLCTHIVINESLSEDIILPFKWPVS